MRNLVEESSVKLNFRFTDCIILSKVLGTHHLIKKLIAHDVHYLFERYKKANLDIRKAVKEAKEI